MLEYTVIFKALRRHHFCFFVIRGHVRGRDFAETSNLEKTSSLHTSSLLQAPFTQYLLCVRTPGYRTQLRRVGRGGVSSLYLHKSIKNFRDTVFNYILFSEGVVFFFLPPLKKKKPLQVFGLKLIRSLL